MTEPDRPRARRRRRLLVVLAVVFGAIAWGTKELIEALLADGRVIDLGVLSLRLAYNPGVSFSLGADLPTWVVLGGTGLVTLVLAGYAWSVVASTPVVGTVGLAAILAGAVTNLVNRAIDGAVTDYFHTGWFPTFNAPDALITVGAVLVVLAFLLPSARAAEAAS